MALQSPFFTISNHLRPIPPGWPWQCGRSARAESIGSPMRTTIALWVVVRASWIAPTIMFSGVLANVFLLVLSQGYRGRSRVGEKEMVRARSRAVLSTAAAAWRDACLRVKADRLRPRAIVAYELHRRFYERHSPIPVLFADHCLPRSMLHSSALGVGANPCESDRPKRR